MHTNNANKVILIIFFCMKFIIYNNLIFVFLLFPELKKYPSFKYSNIQNLSLFYLFFNFSNIFKIFSFKIGLLNIPSTLTKVEYLRFNYSSSESAELYIKYSKTKIK